MSSMNGDLGIRERGWGMTRTLADMTPAERDEHVGMWCEDMDGDLVILECSCVKREDGQVVVEALYPPTRDRLEYRASELTPRLDLPRAWTPSGEPVPGEWEERTNQDGIGDRIWFTRQRRYITDWELVP